MADVQTRIRDRALPEIAANITLHSGAAIVVAPPVDAPAIRSGIAMLEAAMVEATELQVYLEPVHRFAQGLYCRELTLPAGTIAVGHRHAQQHICIVSQGTCEAISETGGARLVAAPATFVVPAGTKNAVRAITDTVWTTVHATELTDVAAIEASVLLPPDTELLQ